MCKVVTQVILTSTIEGSGASLLGTGKFLFDVHRAVVVAQVALDLEGGATDTTRVRILVLVDRRNVLIQRRL